MNEALRTKLEDLQSSLSELFQRIENVEDNVFDAYKVAEEVWTELDNAHAFLHDISADAADAEQLLTEIVVELTKTEPDDKAKFLAELDARTMNS